MNARRRNKVYRSARGETERVFCAPTVGERPIGESLAQRRLSFTRANIHRRLKTTPYNRSSGSSPFTDGQTPKWRTGRDVTKIEAASARRKRERNAGETRFAPPAVVRRTSRFSVHDSFLLMSRFHIQSNAIGRFSGFLRWRLAPCRLYESDSVIDRI